MKKIIIIGGTWVLSFLVTYTLCMLSKLRQLQAAVRARGGDPTGYVFKTLDAKLGFLILIGSIFLTWVLFKMFPTEPTLPNIATVVATVFGILIGFYFLAKL